MSAWSGLRRETRFFVIFLVGLALIPLLGLLMGQRMWTLSLSVGSYCLIYMIAAQALNVQVGFTGLLNLGPIAFVGIGAYTGALLLTYPNAAGDPALVSFYTSILPDLSGHARWVLFFLDPNFLAYVTVAPAAVIMSVLLSVGIGIPTLKLTGDYFAIVTLGFAQIFYLVVKNEAWLTKGAFGVKDVPPLFSFCEGADKIVFMEKTAHYFFGVAVLALSLWVVVRLRESYMGRSLTAVRDNELAAQSNGVNVVRARMVSFVVFSALAALAGLVLVARNKFLSPSDLNFMESILYLCCVVLGGMGSVRGTLVGAVVLGALGEVMRLLLPELSELTGWDIPLQIRYVLFGMILILVMRFRPNGLLPVADEEEARGREALGDHRDVTPTLFALAGKEPSK
jgi:branched-chain amino acid transport system permease protein